MKFFEGNWFILLISFVVSLVITLNNKPIEFTGNHLLYFSLELFILTVISFIVIKGVSILFFKLSQVRT